MAINQSHILIIASWYISKESPFAGSFIHEQALLLHRKGHKVCVIHPYMEGTFLDTLFKSKKTHSSEVKDGIVTLRIGRAPLLPKTRQLGYRMLAKDAEKILKDYIVSYGKPDVIHSHAMFMGGIIGMHLSKVFTVPLVHTEHSSAFINNPAQFTASDLELSRSVFSHAKQSFFVSQFALEKTLETLNLEQHTSSVVPNCVSNAFFESALTTQRSSPTRFLAINNLVEVKNIPLLLDAWKRFTAVHGPTDAQLTIAGNGPLKEEIEQLIAALELHESVTLTAGLERNQVVTEISKSNVVVSASRVETFGLTLAEAIATGTPVLATNSGGPRDIVTSINGFLVNHDAEQLSNGLKQVMLEFEKFTPEAIRKEALEKFSEDVIYAQLSTAYHTIHDAE